MAKQCTMRVVSCSGRTRLGRHRAPRSVERSEAAGGIDQIDFVKGQERVGLGGEPAPMAVRLPPDGFHFKGFGHSAALLPRSEAPRQA